MKRSNAKFWCLGLMSLLWSVSGSVQAGMYVYQLPDGSRIISDYVLKGSYYKLIRAEAYAKGVDIVTASKNPQYFRINPANYDHVIRQAAATYRVEAALLKAVMRAESAFNPYATSNKGASGLMQLMPATAKRFGVTDIYDPEQNIQAGARYLRFLLTKFKHNHSLAIAAYNAGEGTVMRYKGIPPYNETQDYVKKVLRFKLHYASVFS